MPCSSTSQLNNAPSPVLPLTQPQTPSQWNYFVARLQDIINSIRDASTRQPVNIVPADYAVYNGAALPALSISGASAALDTTKHQFGAASLKLTATAATVTVEFSADPILLPPNSDWIESVYIQSSRTAIAGTLALDTPGGSYPVDISGNLLPSTWGRLYGDCDLRADGSTTATMALTLTGCTVGDTFNLEGWQIEHATGSTNLPSPFVNTTVPQGYVDTVANAAEALTNAATAQTAANTANAQLANIASDNILSPAEKPTVIRDYAVITAEQAGIDAQALAYLGTASSQQVAYDNAITALTAYLATLTAPVVWNDKSGNTTIVGTTFRANFNTVYTTRQTLLNAIYQQAKTLANNAQGTANTAQTTGTNAQNTANTANTTANTANANTPTVLNPNFMNGVTGWLAAQGWTSDATPRAIYTGFAGASGTLTLANTINVPCVPGSQIIGQALLSSNAANGVCYAGVEFLDSSQNHLAYAFGNSITGTTAATLSRKVAVAPASAAFARFFLGAANCTSGTYYAQSCLMTVTLSSVDELPDGSTHARTLATTLQNGVPLQTAGGKNALPNGAFSSNLNGTPVGVPLGANGSVSDGWKISGAVAACHQVLYEASSGGTDILVRLIGGSVIAANAGIASVIQNVPNIGVAGDTPYAFSLTRDIQNNVALPSGITVLLRTYINWLAGDGSQISTSIVDVGGNSVSKATVWASGTAPANAVAAQIVLQPAVFSSNGTATTLPAGDPADMRWYNVQLVFANNLDNEVVDGPNFGRTSQTYLSSNRPVFDLNDTFHRNKTQDYLPDGTTYARILGSQLTNGQHNLEVAGSGHQLGDQRANLPVNSAGPVSNWRNLTISYTASPTSATISVTAASIVGILPNAVWLNYNASSTTVSGSAGTSKTYYLYYNDPNFSGGTQTLNPDTNGNNIYVLGHVYIGSVVVNFPTSGSGTGGGSGGLCVADEMFIGEGCLAGDAEIGDPFDCIDLPTQAGKHQRALQGVTRGTEECVRMITDNGCALICSVSTPFDLPDGRSTTAPRMLGEQVITDLGTATVSSLALVGPRHVTRAHLGGVSYAAGADPARRIYSHNLSPVKP